MKSILYIVVPCYNEQDVLPVTAPLFLKKLEQLIAENKISEKSKILFVNDGSTDKTWEIICNLAKSNLFYMGISQSRNRGHQSALLAGLMEAKDLCDITISIDCDGQDDINVIDKMIQEYENGSEVVYAVRDNRTSDSFFKKFTAESFYKIMNLMGAETIFNHADYRLLSRIFLNEFESFKEVNLFLRGMIPLVGFKSSRVYYSRTPRLAGETHYPLKKMLALALNGITSLSIKPIRLITLIGFIFAFISLIGILWSLITALTGYVVAGWTSVVCIVCLVGGINLLCIGVIGEYIGKIYLETKSRPRFIISERTGDSHKQR